MINYHFAIFGISATCQDWNSCTLNLDSGQDQIFQRKWEHIKEEESEGIRGNGAPLSQWIRGKRLEYRNCPDDKWCVFSGEQELYLRSEGNQEASCERKSLKVPPNLFSIINEQMRNISSVYRTLYFTNVLGCDLKKGENYKRLWNRIMRRGTSSHSKQGLGAANIREVQTVSQSWRRWRHGTALFLCQGWLNAVFKSTSDLGRSLGCN